MDPERPLHADTATEMQVRDARTAGYDARMQRLGAANQAEMIPTLSELQRLAGASVLELGCGTGRYTVPVLRECRTLVAVDVSLESLRVLAGKLPDDREVGLVQADIGCFVTAGQVFDRVLSTLVSNLPTASHRDAMYRLAARAMTSNGKFVFSTHHYGAWEWLLREPVEANYGPEFPVYRRLFRADEIVQEARSQFGRVNARYVQIVAPWPWRIELPVVALSRIAERVPGLNRLAKILLFTAEQPRR